MEAADDEWWVEVLPLLENETAIGPPVNPFRELYWKRYRGPNLKNLPPDEKSEPPERSRAKTGGPSRRQ